METNFPYLGETDYFDFPSVNSATPEGIIGMGGNLSPGMLLSAYRQGIFPWFSEEDPILWWNPDPRFVLFTDKLHIPRSLKRFLRNHDPYTYTLDNAFERVIEHCAYAPRPDQDGTWITEDMIDGYNTLHTLGYAHSVEVWHGKQLVGGMYGVSLGKAFFGESMFSIADNASKAALVLLVLTLSEAGFPFMDSQVYTPNVEKMGARNISRDRYLALLSEALKGKTLKGEWHHYFPHFPDTSGYRAILNK